jgi:2'-5' RNA ligase
MSDVRAFIALEMPPDIHQALAAASWQLKQELKDLPLRWVPVDNIHLTIQFIGEVEQKKLQLIKDVMAEKARHVQPFDISLAGMGVFPDMRKPLVLWVGVQSSAQLNQLQEEIHSGLRQRGFDLETRPYTPHLTLARVRRERRGMDLQQLAAAMRAYRPAQTPVEFVNSVALFETKLKAGGTVYNPLARAALGRA